MKTKTQHQLKLNTRINVSGIYQAMQILNQELEVYGGLEASKGNRYCIQREVHKILSSLESQLEVLIEQALVWEAGG